LRQRRSKNEFRHFLYIAKGSCGEVRSMLILATELNKLPSAESLVLQKNAEEISRMITGLIKKL
jgi:four helix bundle protein